MAEIKVKLSRKPADLHAERPVTARKPEPPRRAQAEGQSQLPKNHIVCCNCWSLNIVETSPTHGVAFVCWNCSETCDV